MSTISSRVAPGPVAHVIGSRSARFHRGADWPQLCTFGRVPPTWAVTDPSPFNDERELLLRRFGVQGSWSADAAECVSDDALFLLSQADHLVVLHQIHSAHAGLMFGLGPPARSLLEVTATYSGCYTRT